FQQTIGTVVEDCVCEGNAGHGLHPGSGSVGAVIRHCTCRQNGVEGIYYCLRVSFSLCERSTFEGNGRHGISIGGRDTDHLIRRNVIRANAREGVYFRPHDAVMAGHRNVLEANEVAGNCRSEGDAEIHVAAPVRDVYLLGNRIEPASDAVAPVRVAEGAAVHYEPADPPLAVGPDHAPPDAARHLSPENAEDSP
ncbi:MAG: right-handed parallel beta-helix repeat-containing protein, partial [Planctomycetota bacterium]